MTQSLIHRLHRSHGKTLAYAAYALTMTAAVCGLWALGGREYQVRLDRFRHELADIGDRTAMLVANSIDHVDLLRRQAEAMLAEPSAPESVQHLFTALTPSDSYPGYTLDNIPAGISVDEFANLTGSGALPPENSGAGREIQVALAL